MAQRERSRGKAALYLVIRSVVPIVLALVVAGILMLTIGKNPIAFYTDVFNNGVLGGNWQASAVLMTPLLLVALGLVVVFRGQLWNLGYDGQFMLAGVFVAGLAPQMMTHYPVWAVWIGLTILAVIIGASWTLIPAWLKARYGTNEIITTLVMSSIGIGLTNILVQYFFQDPTVAEPTTGTMTTAQMLPNIPGTRIHIGFIVAIVAAVVLQFVISRTSFGLRLDIFGSSTKAARHVGINSTKMIFALFIISGGLIGLAAAMDIFGQWGYMRTNWNPAYGDMVVPFVFLARLSPLGCIPFIAFYSIFSTGGIIASQDSGLSSKFLLVIVALILIFMSITEYIGTKRDLGQSYLPDELKEVLRRPFDRIASQGARR